MRRRIRIVANPASGRGRSLRKAAEVVRILRAQGCEVDLAETRGPGDAERIAAASADFDAIVAVGGDGTVHAVANGLTERGGPALAIIPAGTANVLARELGLPSSAAGLARVVAEGREIAWDLGIERRRGRKFVLFGSAGFDAQVVHDFHSRRRGPIHMADYVWRGVRTFTEYSPPRVRVVLDGRELPERASWVIVSTAAGYGGPIAFTPRASHDDGLFDVLVQRGRHRMDTVHLFGSALLNWAARTAVHPPDTVVHRAARVELAAEESERAALQLDGDPAGFLPAELEVIRGGLRLLGPA